MDFLAQGLAKIIGSLRNAIDREEIWKIKLFLAAHPALRDVPDPDYEGYTPLLIAVAENKAAAVECLIKAGATLSQVDPKNEATPLHWAAYYGHTALVQLLIRSGAGIEAKEKAGQKPLHWAARRGQIKAAEALLSAKAELNALDNRGATPLIYAIEHDREAMVRFLLQKKARLDVTDCFAGTALTYAAKKPAILSLLQRAVGGCAAAPPSTPPSKPPAPPTPPTKSPTASPAPAGGSKFSGPFPSDSFLKERDGKPWRTEGIHPEHLVVMIRRHYNILKAPLDEVDRLIFKLRSHAPLPELYAIVPQLGRITDPRTALELVYLTGVNRNEHPLTQRTGKVFPLAVEALRVMAPTMTVAEVQVLLTYEDLGYREALIPLLPFPALAESIAISRDVARFRFEEHVKKYGQNDDEVPGKERQRDACCSYHDRLLASHPGFRDQPGT